MTKDEKKFVKAFVTSGDDIEKVRKYIKENFNIDSVYDETELTLKLECHDINESLQLIAAKEYVEKNTNSEFVTIIF